MSTNSTQISAAVRPETKARLERYAERTGIKKTFLIEAALQHHLSALDFLPDDVVVPAELVVTRQTGEALIDLIENPAPATPALVALFADD